MTEAQISQTRPDFAVIAEWIKPGQRILDLGCGDGSLLKWLEKTRGVSGWGVEIDPVHVLDAIRNGVNVIQSDLENGLQDFANGAFDHVVLSRTLQTVQQTQAILHEMLRVGREAVVSFPNFAYWKNLKAVLKGRMPVSEDLPYQWYDSPNVRFFTLLDFEALCEQMHLTVKERLLLDENGKTISNSDACSADDLNFLASLVVYRLSNPPQHSFAELPIAPVTSAD